MDIGEDWTTRLAAVLAGDVPGTDRQVALSDLAATYSTGLPPVDETRQRILRLLGYRDALSAADPASASVTDPAQAAGVDGISLVAVDLGQLAVAAVRNWLSASTHEVVLVDGHTTPPLAERLTSAGIADPRLRLIRIDDEAVTWTQGFNIGLRAARHARLWAIGGSTRLAPTVQAAALPAGNFAVENGQGDPTGFLLDLNRNDLTAVGGFNEYLESPDWAVEELVGRLSAQGLQRRTLPPGLLAQGPKPAAAAPLPATGTLRDALRQSPNFAALQNRFIAVAMPKWAASAQLPSVVLGSVALGQHIRAQSSNVTKMPLHIKTTAATNALIELLRDRMGGHPERLSPRRLDTVLGRPVNDVSAVDIAVAASNAPETVKTRKAWLLIDLAADSLPVKGSPQARAMTSLLHMADQHGQTPVLCVDTADTAAALTGLTPCTILTGPPPSNSFWPIELRELARPLGDRAPRHATMPFNSQSVTDHDSLVQSPMLLLRRPKIFIDAQHGLGNRMRAIASAGAIAAGTDRELVIIWQPDDHCACTYDDLFFSHGAVLDHGFVTEASDFGLQVFNYMEIEPDAAKDAPIAMGAFQDVYIRSAFPLNSPCSNWHTENLWIRNLQPNEVVRALVASVRSPNDLGVHVRMEGGPEAEHLPYESPRNWTAAAHQEIGHWRKRSHFRHFLPRLDQLIAQGLANKVFLAADTQGVYAEFEARYGNRIAWLPRPSSDRSAQSIVYALADALLLGRAPRLLGSTWSSFSELAARLSPAPMTVELTGRDF
ncbi:MAG: hypothetical protein H7245_23500 [Candidatus Saccharibacteria bacterium]|nr:hypothetical protein [Pseudorhodobacter sp.]